MDSRTLELFRCLQSGPFDEAGLKQIQSLLGSQRRALAAKNDLGTLQEIVQLLEGWAIAAGSGRLSAAALGEAADIAERELRQLGLANELRARAVRSGRRTGDPTIEVPHPEATAEELSAAIERAESALEADASTVNVRALADLYARRGGQGDRAQAAELYCTLGEVLGKDAGVELLQLALMQAPEHAEARQLLATYTGTRASQVVLPRISTASLEAVRPNVASAALVSPPPLGAAKAAGLNLDASLSSPRISAPRLQAVPSAPAPLGASSGASMPASSLSPVVLSETEPDAEAVPAPRRGWRWAAAGLGMCAVAAGFLLARPMLLQPEAAQDVPHALGSAPAAQPEAASAPSEAMAAQPAAAEPLKAAEPSAPEQPKAADSPAQAKASTEQAAAPAVEPSGKSADAVAPPAQPTAAAEPSAAEPAEDKPVATKKDSKPAPAAHKVAWLMDQLTIRGGAMNPQQLEAALDKAQSQLDGCYRTALDKKPRLKGKLVLGFTVKPNGHPTAFKHLGGNIKEPELIQCTVRALEATRLPRPRKAAAKVKLPFQYQPG